eukprot:g59643.t1
MTVTANSMAVAALTLVGLLHVVIAAIVYLSTRRRVAADGADEAQYVQLQQQENQQRPRRTTIFFVVLQLVAIFLWVWVRSGWVDNLQRFFNICTMFFTLYLYYCGGDSFKFRPHGSPSMQRADALIEAGAFLGGITVYIWFLWNAIHGTWFDAIEWSFQQFTKDVLSVIQVLTSIVVLSAMYGQENLPADQAEQVARDNVYKWRAGYMMSSMKPATLVWIFNIGQPLLWIFLVRQLTHFGEALLAQLSEADHGPGVPAAPHGREEDGYEPPSGSGVRPVPHYYKDDDAAPVQHGQGDEQGQHVQMVKKHSSSILIIAIIIGSELWARSEVCKSTPEDSRMEKSVCDEQLWNHWFPLAVQMSFALVAIALLFRSIDKAYPRCPRPSVACCVAYFYYFLHPPRLVWGCAMLYCIVHVLDDFRPDHSPIPDENVVGHQRGPPWCYRDIFTIVLIFLLGLKVHFKPQPARQVEYIELGDEVEYIELGDEAKSDNDASLSSQGPMERKSHRSPAEDRKQGRADPLLAAQQEAQDAVNARLLAASPEEASEGKATCLRRLRKVPPRNILVPILIGWVFLMWTEELYHHAVLSEEGCSDHVVNNLEFLDAIFPLVAEALIKGIEELACAHAELRNR